MSLWEYKVITSGKGGFATPALLEKFLNDLGRDEWEIVHFQTAPENFLAFTGLARRSTQRDWTLEDAAAAAAKAEADKLRAEFEAKFKAASQPAAAEERAPSFLEEKAAPDDGFRKPVDTSHDAEPEDEEEAKADEWDKLTAAEEDELPTFFEAIKPHMRRNQRGPGMSVGVDYLAKKWDQNEDDLKGALEECGFVVPADEDAKPEYLEYDGDLYWLNINRRGELWINTKEKPRPVFRPVKAQKVTIEEPAKQPQQQQPEAGAGGRNEKPDTGDRKPEAGGAPAEAAGTEASQEAGEGAVQSAKPAQPGAPLPEGAALLDKIRPHMRRNRRGPGGSGSTTFLSRALRTNEADLKAAFTALGLAIPGHPNDKPQYVEIGKEVWWLNIDSRGGLWINGREKREGENLGAPKEGAPETPAEEAPGAPAATDAVPSPEVAPAAAVGSTPTEQPAIPVSGEASSRHEAAAGSSISEAVAPPTPSVDAVPEPGVAPSATPENPVLAGVRGLLKETKTGAIAAKIDRVAEQASKSVDDVIAALVSAGLKVPEKPREKPVFVEHAGEIFWINKNARGELWLNAKPSKFADKPNDEDGENEESGAEVEAGAGVTAGGEATESEAEGEKKSRRGGRGRKKAESPE